MARRVKVLPLQTSFFSIRRVAATTADPLATKGGAGGGKTSKIAAGMEVKYVVTFRPESIDDYATDVVVVTEREKFLVSVKAIGARAALDFPSYYNFDACPVGIQTRKTFLVHNVGEKMAAFSIEVPQPPTGGAGGHVRNVFDVTPREATLDCGESMQCEIAFTPQETLLYSSPVSFKFFDGAVAEALFEGCGGELDISLQEDKLYLMPTFISRSSQKRFRIVNRSKQAAKFSFQQFMDRARDEDERMRAMVELDGEESESLSELELNIRGEDKIVELQEAMYEMHRVFNLRRRDIENEGFRFADEQYAIEPLSGTVLPMSELEITVRFSPKGPLEHQRIAYLEIQGRAMRLPLQISGQGIGPKAVFSYDVLDVGDTYVNTLHQYEVEIHNRGQIEAEFALEEPSTEFGKRFKFEPSAGLLTVNEIRTIKVFLQSDILGEFAESFVWKVAGASEDLVLDFRGRVVGPTFQLSCTEIDYGTVSYGFKYMRGFTITNTSEIPMEYIINVVGSDEAKRKDDFVVYPYDGKLLPNCKEEVRVELNSNSLGTYDTEMLIEAKVASDKSQKIHLKGISMVPEITLSKDVLDFGDCFLGYPYKSVVQLINDSELPAKFRIQSQDAQSKGLAEYSSTPNVGEVPANSTVDVTFDLCTTRLGRINLPALINIVGGRGVPLEVVLASKSMGPILGFSSSSDVTDVVESIEFGKVTVLKDFHYTLHMHNPSLIPAEFKTFIAAKDSVFSVDMREGSLQPNESCTLTVTVHMDETMKFTDELHVLILEGDDVCIPLSASGIGSTIQCYDLDVIQGDAIDTVKTECKFGSQLTNSTFKKEIVLQNFGRRSQNIQWSVMANMMSSSSVDFKKTGNGMKSMASNVGGQNSRASIETLSTPSTFKIMPDRIKIPPKTACTFTISGISPDPGFIEEYLLCESVAGKSVRAIYEVAVSADVAHPLLEFSDGQLSFCYSYSEEDVEPIPPLKKPLKIKNISKLAVAFTMRTQFPFQINEPEWRLEPEEEAEATVLFDMTKACSGHLSQEFTSQIIVSYPENPHKDVIRLHTEVNYPNLSFNRGRVDFGCILNDTLAREYLQITNVSKVDAKFSWYLQVYDQKNALQQTFDILPTQGVVGAGETRDIEFTFFAQQGTHSSASAVCEVQGGPNYDIPITADSSTIRYTVEPRVIDLGPQSYDKVMEQDLMIQNIGRVPFEYSIDLETMTRHGIVDAYPMTGYLNASQKQFLTLKITAGIPERIDEVFRVRIAHFEPEEIKVRVDGVYPYGVLSIPRLQTDEFTRMLELCKSSLKENGPSAVFAAKAFGNLKGTLQSETHTAQTGRSTAGRLPTSMGASDIGSIMSRSDFNYDPSTVELEAEADRMLLCDHLMKIMYTSPEEREREGGEDAASGVDGGATAPQKSMLRKNAKTLLRKNPPAVSHYVLDFGYVIKGTQKSKKFKMDNISSSPITFSIDKYVLESHGFYMDPKFVIRLQGAYEFASTDINVTLNAKSDAVSLGRLEHELSLDVRKGPRIAIHLVALITIPELKISTTNVDFGSVQSGYARTSTLEFYNPKEVPCEWSLSKPRNVGPDWYNFTLEPTSGLLAPGESQFVKLTFTPDHNQDREYKQKLPIKIVRNKKNVALTCTATGYSLHFKIEPPFLSMGACLPKPSEEEGGAGGEGGAANDEMVLQKEFSLINDCDHDIEVIAMDFDKQYLIDEEMMQSYSKFEESTDGTTILKPLGPGQKLWPEMVQEYKAKQKALKKAEGGEGEGDPPQEKAAGGEGEGKSPDASAQGEDKGEDVGDLEVVGGSTQGVGEPLFVVLDAPSCSGSQKLCTTEAQMLSQRYGIPCVSMDAMINDGAELLRVAKEEEGQEEEASTPPKDAKGGKGKEPPPEDEDEKRVKALQAVLKSKGLEKGFVLDSLASGILAEGEEDPSSSKKKALALLLKAFSFEKIEHESDGDDPKGAPIEWTGKSKLNISLIKLADKGVVKEEETTQEASDATDSQPATVGEGEGKEGDGEKASPPAAASAAEAESEAKAEEGGEGADEYLKFKQLYSLVYSTLTEDEEDKVYSDEQMASCVLGAIDFALVDHDTSSDTPLEALLDGIVGIGWDLGEIYARLPLVDSDASRLPPAYTYQIVQKPRMRGMRMPVLHHKLFMKADSKGKEEAQEGAGAEGSEKADALESVTGRWLIPARSSLDLVVKFSSDDVGDVIETLGFEIASFGGPANYGSIVCQSTCSYPQLSQDYRNVFYRKVKALTKKAPNTIAIANKQYVVSEQTFEFGPLICMPDQDATTEEYEKLEDHSSAFRMTNCGLFDLDVEFKFKSELESGKPSTTFTVNPKSMHLAIDETKDLSVYAVPKDVETYEDVLMCTINKNPKPVEINVSCIGAKPYVTIEGDLDEAAAGGQTKKGDEPISGTIDFGRLLVGHRDDRKLVLQNPTLLPVSWKILNASELANGMSLSLDEGIIYPKQSETLLFKYNAITNGVFESSLNMEIRHAVTEDGATADADSSEADQSIQVNVKFEAYEIEVDVTFPEDNRPSEDNAAGAGLNYGLMRAESSSTRPVMIKNNGKYEVGFNVMAKSARARDLFKFEPSEGKVGPGDSVTFNAVFNGDQNLTSEIKLHSSSDITIGILETLTEKTEHVIPVRVDVDAVFNKYVIRPGKGINFGPHIYDTSSAPKTFEILNKGSFDFDFEIDPYNANKSGEEGSKDKGKGANLAVGNFTVEPVSGNIKPGESTTITVNFKAEAERTYCEILGIDVKGRDPLDCPGGIQYEISGESCIPGIETRDVQSIFEEHMVVASVDPFTQQLESSGEAKKYFVYSISDREFSFGPVVANLENISSEDNPHAVSANLKIINPTKVPCNVKYALKPRQTSEGGDMDEQSSAITLTPAETHIPPHEHRYITLTFNPHSIGTYLSTFEATVDGGIDAQTRCFSCSIRGEGTLPHVAVEGLDTASTLPTLKFDRILQGRSSQKSVLLKNVGILNAKFRLEMPDDPDGAYQIRSSGSRSSITRPKEDIVSAIEGKWVELAPKQILAVSIQFSPNEVKGYSHKLKVIVHDNPFDSQTIALEGECYTQIVSFEGLPRDSENELHIPDRALSDEPFETTFTIASHAENTIRFAFPECHTYAGVGEDGEEIALGEEAKGIIVTPTVGHLEPGERKSVTLGFLPKEATKLDAHDLAVAITQIKLGEPAEGASGKQTAASWDNRVSIPLLKGATSPAESSEEPAFEAVPKSDDKIEVKVFALADDAKPECDLKPINFKPTMMFQSRVYSFVLQNTSMASFPFEFRVTSDADSFGEMDEHSNPYTVTPASGSIEAGSEQNVVVRFAPTETDENNFTRMLECEIPNLAEGMAPIKRQLSGKALRPWCHFDLPEVDMQSLQQIPAGNANAKVIQFESLGIRVKNTRRFTVYNPTNVAYEFRWDRDESRDGGKSNVFRCMTRRGQILPGKKFEMAFEFVPEANATYEMSWTFAISAHNIAETFLLFGVVSEPRVLFDRHNLHFGKVLMGTKANQVVNLVNHEHIPFAFNMDSASYMENPEGGLLEFEPSAGTVGPNASMPVRVTFQPTKEKLSNYNISCVVKKKPTKLSLNVKGEGYAIHNSLLLGQPDGDTYGAMGHVELSGTSVNHIDFGQVQIYEKAIKQLSLVNTGDVNFSYVINVGGMRDEVPSAGTQYVSISPDSGTVMKGEQVQLELCFNPRKAMLLDGFPVVCSTVNGNTYTMQLAGVGYKPRLDFSFTNYDFGPCFMYQNGMKVEQATLVVVNNDDRDISFDVDYRKSDHLTVDTTTVLLSPGQKQEIAIQFRPQKAMQYVDTVTFEINGLYTVPVGIKGEGVPVVVEVTNPRNEILQFGSIRAMESVMKSVKVVNHSKLPVTLSPQPALPYLTRHNVTMFPSHDMYLRPREATQLNLSFSPLKRLRPFSQEVVFNCLGLDRKMFTVSGACLGVELRLSNDNIQFGGVVAGNAVTKSIFVENVGDVGTNLEWSVSTNDASFSIYPSRTFVSAQQDAKIDVTFHPTSPHSEPYMAQFNCFVQEGQKLSLSLSGMCIEQKPEGEAVSFSTKVRQEEVKAIKIKNDTSDVWQLKPVIHSDMWSGPETFTVQANATGEYPLTYKPHAMTSEGALHESSIFFPFPDGSGALHRLVGEALPPESAGSIQVKCNAKKRHVELIKVANWINKPQRFQCAVEIEDSQDATVEMTGPEFIDVAGLSTREYKLSFQCHKEGETKAKVTFKNPNTGEYLYYNVIAEAGPPDVQGMLVLECPVRQKTTDKVIVTNPLDKDVTLAVTADDSQVAVPAEVVLKAKAIATIDVAFRPILPVESETQLNIQSEELGSFPYLLKLKGVPAESEGRMTFMVPLGGKETQPFQFMHYANTKVEYTCKFASAGGESGFVISPSVTAHPAGTEGNPVSVDVTFEPTQIGESFRDTLIVSSPVGGEYVCPLLGRCVPPKPQGPILVSGGSGVLNFKNVLNQEAKYFFTVDNPSFSVKAEETIGSKKNTKVTVSYKSDGESPNTGKLTIRCAETPSSWVYYLKA